MNLRISNPRARELAFQLAARRKVSMTRAVIDALENELVREQEQTSLAGRLAAIADDLGSKAGLGRAVSKDEIDEMWSNP
ncbi:type II toxin-antitoxin system VapB family antitoxin [Mesorhizobium sp. WSM3626]|uniref:type II toxin-antitoxin system VapB family antitoxin n=1 Tax=Mesorhizobium sp. WSM3626 TaxID=1040987 RepID=UPI000517E68A|nr:type II toxin-antitoxin system VapB family antitoxin [Mesorhizobium sp. WSM3626]